jgi:hypothetical protein
MGSINLAISRETVGHDWLESPDALDGCDSLRSSAFGL